MGPEDALEAIAYLNPGNNHSNSLQYLSCYPTKSSNIRRASSWRESIKPRRDDPSLEEIMATKHDQILKHIEDLPIGDRISVRSIAKSLSVSEGTAYRAIKDAENIGLVSTIQRVGTIRIERKLKTY